MCDASVSLSAADVGDPLPEHRSINERVTPEDIADARVRADEVAGGFVLDEADLAGDQRPEIVVHNIKVKALQVRDVPRNVERVNLPLAAR
jgi:hypothetical protein